MNSDLEIRTAQWSRDADALQQLRTAVFVQEQGVPADIEWDGQDAQAEHVIAQRGAETVGCGRLLADGRIGRLAVQSQLRGSGIGARLLQALLDRARATGLAQVYLHAQVTALGFYERAGFVGEGDEFLEAGIAHRNMTQMLDYRDWDSDVFPLHYPAPFAQLAIAQARQCRRELAVLSPHLDRAVFDNEEFFAALRKLLRESRRSRVRVLLQNSRAVVQQGHGLVELARRLPSRIELRVLAEHADWNGDTQVLRDRSAVLVHPGGDGNPGSYRPGDRGRCEAALTRFEELWRVGVSNPELRALSL